MKYARWFGLGMVCATGYAQAAGFALVEQNDSGLGNAYAGQAAVAEDASAIYYNPAGLARLSGDQLVASASLILPSARFKDDGGSQAAALQARGGNGGDAGALGVVPNLYWSREVKPGVHVGIGVNAPFGLKTEYDADWIGRFQAVESELKTINVNPTLALRLNDQFALGIGLDAQWVEANLSNRVNYSAAIAQATGGTVVMPGLEGLARIKGDDWGFGYNLGLLWEPSGETRVGLNYRSRIDYTLEGLATFSDRPAALAAALPDGDVHAKLTVPDSLSLSLFQRLSPAWEMLADVTWTGWKVFDELAVRRDDGSLLTRTPENWKDSMRYSLGFNYHAGARLTWRFGTAYDQTPVPDAYRTARIPDEDRAWLALGARYELDKASVLNFGYAHLFVNRARIESDARASGGGVLSGRYDNHVDILSVQYTRHF